MSYKYAPNLTLGLPFGVNEVGWRGDVLRGFRAAEELFHLSNPASGDLVNRTQALCFRDFRITQLPNVISGISVQVRARRNGRIVDEQIQLTYQDQLIGRNKFNYEVDENGNVPIVDNSSYGGNEDLWGAEITAEMLQDPTFGVILKFQGHPYFPHRSALYLDEVSLTIY